MNKKTYLKMRLVFAAVIAGVVSISVTQGNYLIPLIIAVTAALALYAMKKSVKEVIEDERDYQTAGNAARWSVIIYATLAAAGSMVLMSMRQQDPSYELAGSVLAYSACFLMLLQSILFKYFEHREII